MMKKWIRSLLLMGILSFLFVFQTMALNNDLQKPRLVDEEELLTSSEANSLLEMLDEISRRQECDVIVLTVDSLNGKTATEYADDYYDYNNYGFGSGKDGILLLISMEDRDWAISTCGYAITAFTDAGQEYMVKKFKPELSNGNYTAAFTRFAELCDDFLTQAKTEKAYDIGELPKEPLSLSWILYSLLIGAALALIITGIMRRQLKSVRRQASAANYVRANSLNITKNQEMFLYSHVDQRAKPQDTGSSGGSSTHSSSSGQTHGGSSGKF